MLTLAAIPAAPRPLAGAQCFPPLLSLAAFYTPQPGFVTDSTWDSSAPGVPLTNTQRWYFSFLTQQRLIAVQVEELTARLKHNLMSTEEFLDRLDPLLQRADRLYTQWRSIGAVNAERLRASEGRRAVAAGTVALSGKSAVSPPGRPDCERRGDVAVGKSLNYLRLSIVNLFLGYADSNGRQIDDAEKQAGLSVVWRSKSLSFINALEPLPAQPEF